MINIGANIWTASRNTGEALARPSAPGFTVDPDEANGAIILTVTAEPASWGDLAVPGDGLGEEGPLQWWNPRDGWQELVDPSATGVFPFTLHVSLWGRTVQIKVRGVSAAGRVGATVVEEVEVPGPLMVEEIVTSGGIPVTSGGVIVTAFVLA